MVTFSNNPLNSTVIFLKNDIFLNIFKKNKKLRTCHLQKKKKKNSEPGEFKKKKNLRTCHLKKKKREGDTSEYQYQYHCKTSKISNSSLPYQYQ